MALRIYSVKVCMIDMYFYNTTIYIYIHIHIHVCKNSFLLFPPPKKKDGILPRCFPGTFPRFEGVSAMALNWERSDQYLAPPPPVGSMAHGQWVNSLKSPSTLKVNGDS